MVEAYPAWYLGDDIPKIFRICAVFEDSYYYDQDAFLMFASKGGIGLDSLLPGRIIGPRTKDHYVTALTKVVKSFYGDGSESSDGSDLPPLDGVPTVNG